MREENIIVGAGTSAIHVYLDHSINPLAEIIKKITSHSIYKLIGSNFIFTIKIIKIKKISIKVLITNYL